MRYMIGLGLTVLMTGDKEIDSLEYYMHDYDTVDFCVDCDILHTKIRPLFSK